MSSNLQATRSVPLVILGAGLIGRTLIGQLIAQRQYLATTLGLSLPVVVVATSRLLAHQGPLGIPEEGLTEIAQDGLHTDNASPYIADNLRDLLGRIKGGVVVDVSASSDTGAILLAALEAGHDVVLANKKPLADDATTFDALLAYRGQGRQVRYEATVGAGLPVIRTVQDLVQTGDAVTRIDAALSGTLGYLCSALQNGVAFSVAVRDAHRLGYTEPDPRDDLSGRDVARKAVILARTCGFGGNLQDVSVSSLVPPALADCDAATFLQRLPEADDDIAHRVSSAQASGQVLRFAATITPNALSAGLIPVAADHPLAALRGTGNLIAINSTRYASVPLVVSGPGAGADVTATGVFGDILACAVSRSG